MADCRDVAGAAPQQSRRRPVAFLTASRHLAPCSCVFCGRALSPIYCSFLGVLWGGLLKGNRGSFRLGLALKTPLGRNKVIKLGLFWIVFWIEACGIIFIN